MAKAHPVVRLAYLESRAKGTARPLAEVFATRQCAAMTNCERTFWESQHDAMSRDMSADERNRIIACAQKAGINTDGKTYCSAIGTYGDKNAWVTSRDDAVQALRRKGKSCHGILNVKSSEVCAPEQSVKLAPDIVKRLTRQALKNDPRLRERVKKGKVSRGALREQIIARHSLAG